MKYYATLCTDGHFWGTGESKSESRKEANYWVKESDYTCKLLPSVEISEKLFEKNQVFGGNRDNIGKVIEHDNVLYCEDEAIRSPQLLKDSFRFLSIGEKLNAIWEKLNEEKED